MSRCLPARLALVLFALAILSTRAQAQAPPIDPFLGVSILTTGASAPGQPVVATNALDITVSGISQPALSLSSLSGGYDASVLDPIQNFSAAPFSFATTAVFNANGTAGTLGQPVTGHRVDQDGNTLAGLGGTFTLTAALRRRAAAVRAPRAAASPCGGARHLRAESVGGGNGGFAIAASAGIGASASL